MALMPAEKTIPRIRMETRVSAMLNPPVLDWVFIFMRVWLPGRLRRFFPASFTKIDERNRTAAKARPEPKRESYVRISPMETLKKDHAIALVPGAEIFAGA